MSEKISCLILGAGGHARVLIDCLRFDPKVVLAGILDANPVLVGQTIDGVLVLGNDGMMGKLLENGAGYFVVGLGGIGNNQPRQSLFELAVKTGLVPLVVRHPSTMISPGAEFGDGCQFLPGSIVNTGAKLGINVLVNSGAIVEHDCIVKDHAHIATGAKLAGGVQVGCGAHIGAGATIRQGVRIGEHAIVGAGSVVVKDVGPGITVAGVPARILEKG